MKQNALLNCDSYKLGHQFMFPEGMTKGYSNFTPRNLDYFNAEVPEGFKVDSIVFFGIQGFLYELKDTWDETFFKRNKEEVLSEYKEFVLPFAGDICTDRIATLHDLGYLPLIIKALPEGSHVPKGVPILTITNTHPEMFWLPNYLETWLSSELWKASTSATRAAVYKKILNKYAVLTGANAEFIQWQGHDFSLRGTSGILDGAKSGAGHLLSFTGTDNLPAVMYLNQYYNGKQTFVGGSVPASEHSVTTAGGSTNELQTLERFLDLFPQGVVSVVSDSYDYWKVLTEYSVALKDKILNRKEDQFGLCKTVFRPDSGVPELIICGDPDSPEGSPENKGSVQVLWEVFGGTTNAKGYKTLDKHVGLIYGDSITPERANTILKLLAKQGFASDNIVFGIGSYTYQHCTRDTLGFAMKMTYAIVNGKGIEIFKDPKTGDGTKKSAKGLLKVIKTRKGYELVDQVSGQEEMLDNELTIVFRNGNILVNDDLVSIRNRVAV